MILALPTIHVRPSAQAIPLAAGCLVAQLPQQDRERASVLDLYLSQSLQEMAEQILTCQPTLVAFPTYVWNRPQVVALTRLLMEERPELQIVAGGPEATADAEGLLAEAPFLAVLRGEGEATFAELVQTVQNGKALTEVAGLSLPTDSGVHHTEPRPVCTDLNSLASPWLTGVLQPQPGGGVLWETARGCPFHCDYCFDARSSEGVRTLDPERLRQELQLFQKQGVSQVWVLDSTFNHPKERGKILLQMLLENAPDIHFHLEAKADFLDRETAELLGQLSCSVQVGLQSAHPTVLQQVNRQLNPELFQKRIRLLERAGVTYGLDLMQGLPGDSAAGFAQSLDFALELAPNQVDIFPLAVLPGTRLADNAQRLGLRASSKPPYQVDTDAFSDELAVATNLFYNRGRSVAYFLPLCRSLQWTPHQTLKAFYDWARCQVPTDKLHAEEEWGPMDILPLQTGFIESLEFNTTAYQAALVDLTQFHFHYAETLAAPSVEPMAVSTPTSSLWKHAYSIAEGVRLLQTRFDLADLSTVEQSPLAQWPRRLPAQPTEILLVHWGHDVIQEELTHEFAAFLRGCSPSQSARDALGRSPDREADEWLLFALEQGLLVPQ